ncbi:MAG TPA: pirin family protein [Azospira sp.]|nr:pirin family protein [Azospira sp.]
MPIQTLLQPRLTDLGGGMTVRRLLPAAARQAVGPFVFFDHFGPVLHGPDSHTDVRPHPHIGLATVTYLFEGAMLHRDSLGSVQRIEPGAINWMTAGRGIVHSERTPEDLQAVPHTIHGLQLWAALPLADEATEPDFAHTPAAAIPVWEKGGATVRVLIGSAGGLTSPVRTCAATLYLDVALEAGASFTLGAEVAERAVYGVQGALDIDGQRLEPHQLAVLEPGQAARIAAAPEADGPVRCAVIGGAPLESRRFIWWNFVASTRERIEAAKEEWRQQRLGTIPGETEFIPLPER